MYSMVSILTLVCAILSCTSILNPVHGQCLSENDNLAIAADTDLSGIQDFNFELFKKLSPKDPNVNFVFSPYSIWNALVLAYFGSSGETERQFQKVLRVTDKVSTLRNWRELEYGYSMRPETSINNTFVMTNRVFFDDSVAIRECMFSILPEELQRLDFKNNPAGAANTINTLVSETTRGHINELVSASVVDQARLVLVNAAFFKGNWASVFKPERTENRPFTPFSGQAVNIPTMTQFAPFKYGFDDAAKFDILELPYVGDQLAMFILRPYTAGQESFQGVVNALTTTTIDNVLKTMKASPIHVFLPKFSLETKIDDELSSALHSMGLTDAFNEQIANFKDFSLDPNLFIRRGVHEAFLEINEEGTEAGAVTAFIIDKIGGSLRFVCDRPFIFLIRDKATSSTLFMGAFKNPPKSQIRTTSPVDQPISGLNNQHNQQHGVSNQQPPETGFPVQTQGQQFIDFNPEPATGQLNPTGKNNQQDGIIQQQTDGLNQQTGTSSNRQQQQPGNVNQGTSYSQRKTKPKNKPEGFYSQRFKGAEENLSEFDESEEPSFESGELSPILSLF